MAKSKIKLNAWAIIAVLSFLYLAFIPYIYTFMSNLLLGMSIDYVFINFFKSIFNLSNALNFVACLAVIICAFTKVDKIAVTLATGLFAVSSLISFVKATIILIEYDLLFNFLGSLFTEILEITTYSLMFIVAAVFSILFFMKKKAPTFIKVIAFLPILPLLLLVCIKFFGNFGNVIEAITNGNKVLYAIFSNSVNTLNKVVELVGFTALIIKFADFKKKPKNTVEISEDVVVENVVAE